MAARPQVLLLGVAGASFWAGVLSMRRDQGRSIRERHNLTDADAKSDADSLPEQCDVYHGPGGGSKCEQCCQEHPDPWPTKCAWLACSGCEECGDVPEWFIGDKGDSCDRACFKRGKRCTTASLNKQKSLSREDMSDIMYRNREGSKTSCWYEAIESGTSWAPFKPPGIYGKCHPAKESAKPTCDAASPNAQRFCNCDVAESDRKPEDRWVLGDQGEDCNAACGAHGRVCSVDLFQGYSADIDENEEIENLYMKLGNLTCSEFNEKGGLLNQQFVPYRDSAGKCFRSNRGKHRLHKSTRFTCEAHKPYSRRLCMCDWPESTSGVCRNAGCARGFRMKDDTTITDADECCEENVCTCNHGTGATGQACETHGREICETCDEGFIFEGQVCVEDIKMVDKWFLGEEGQDCNATCRARGKVCSVALFERYNADIDENEEIEYLYMELGNLACNTFSTRWFTSKDVPTRDSAGKCYRSASNRDGRLHKTQRFNCYGRKGGSRRLCACSDTSSLAEVDSDDGMGDGGEE